MENSKKGGSTTAVRKKSGPKFELSDEQKNDIKEAFDLFDTHGKKICPYFIE